MSNAPKTVVEVGLLATLLSLTIGCEQPKHTSTVENSRVIDAGIVFADKSNYICWPLEVLGIDVSPDQVNLIRTSCECVHGTIVAYQKSNNELGYAMILEFSPEKEKPDNNTQVARLEIIVTVELTSGLTEDFTVLVLSTNRISN